MKFRSGPDRGAMQRGFTLVEAVMVIVLTGIIGVTGVLYSWNIEERVKEFFAFYLVLLGGVYGVFQARDLLLLLVFYEIAIVPK